MLVGVGVASLLAAFWWYRWVPPWERRTFPAMGMALDRPWFYRIHVLGGSAIFATLGVVAIVQGVI